MGIRTLKVYKQDITQSTKAFITKGCHAKGSLDKLESHRAKKASWQDIVSALCGALCTPKLNAAPPLYDIQIQHPEQTSEDDPVK